jgi:aminomethyltransferase
VTAALRTSPLHDRHLALGATLGPFGGWTMPISYSGGGVVAEHTAVRMAVGVFDVSHLGKLSIHGRGAAGFVNRCLTNDLDRIGDSQAQYTLACNDDGGVVDDLIVYRNGDEQLLAVPNAANAARVAELLRAAAPDGVQIDDHHADLAVLAVQGPRSADVLAALGLRDEVATLDYMWFLAHDEVVVCRTGYTGERGFELIAPAAVAPELWDKLLAAAAAAGGRPAGLGARDTLRTEMGYPLHGQDITPEISPVQARLGWAVGWSKPEFWGRQALLTEREAGSARTLRGLRSTGRGVPRPGMRVLRDGTPVGLVTSGTFSPTLRTGIALALLEAGVPVGAEVSIDVRGRALPSEVVKPPFVGSHVR